MMLSIFPEAADSTAFHLTNGRKIHAGNVNFLGRAVPTVEWNIGAAKSSRLDRLTAAENRTLPRFGGMSDAHRLRCCPLNLQSPARVRPNALEHAPANRFQLLSITAKPTPSRSLADRR